MAKRAAQPIKSYGDIWMILVRRLAAAIVWIIPLALILAFLVWIIGGKVIGLNLPGYWILFRWIYIGAYAIQAVFWLGVASVSHFSLAVVCSLVEAPLPDVIEALTVHKLQNKMNAVHWKPGWFKQELQAAREKKAEQERLAGAFMEALFAGAFGLGHSRYHGDKPEG